MLIWRRMKVMLKYKKRLSRITEKPLFAIVEYAMQNYLLAKNAFTSSLWMITSL